jgi:hypothetical protein
MASEVVHVTATEYTTVYPSTLSLATQDRTTFSTMLISSTPSSSSVIETPSPGLTTSPSSTSLPFQDEHQPWNDNIANLMLAAVILMAILLISLLVYTIYQRFRGPCHACSVNKLAVKVITRDMVKARESAEKSGPVRDDQPDLERGEIGLGNATWEDEREKARKEALDALTRPESVLVKPTMWERALGFVGSKNKEPSRSPSPEPERKTSASNDRFFTVDPVTQVFRNSTLSNTLEDDYSSRPSIDRAYDPPSPEHLPSTYYTRPKTTSSRSIRKRPGSEQSEYYSPGPVQSTSPPARSEPFNYSAYLRDDWKADESTVAGALNIREAKRRSRTYGGLPMPEGWEDVDIK